MPIETFHISSESTHNKQQAGNKSICTEERGESYDATNMCSNFGSTWSITPLIKRIWLSWRFHENSHATTKLKTWIRQIWNWSSMKSKMAANSKTEERKLDIDAT